MKNEILIDFVGHGERFVPHLWSKERKIIGRKDVCKLTTPRTELTANDVEEGRDRVYLRVGGEDWFGGIINDVRREDDESAIFADSWERLAEGAEPTEDVDEWVNAKDSAIIKDAISDIPELKPGSIETTNPAVSILFSHDSQRTKIRDPANRSPGILRFNPDKTVDYGNLGRDKTEITLSPRKHNVENSIEIDRTTIEGRITHLRIIGAGEGKHQKVANIVPESDPDTGHLENVRTYENPDWNGEGDTEWSTKADKKIADSGTLGDAGLTYIKELRSARVEAKLTVKGIHVELGDRFRVYVPEEGFDRNLEVVELRRVIDTAGRRYELVLSNHRKTRKTPDEKKVSDLEDYRHAVEGAAVPIQGGGSRQPVNGELNWVDDVDYPTEVEFEHDLAVVVRGQPYRAYSSGAVDNADFESAVVSKTAFDSAPITSNWDKYSTITPSKNTSAVSVFSTFQLLPKGDPHVPEVGCELRLVAYTSEGTVYHPDQSGTPVVIDGADRQVGAMALSLPQDLQGVELQLQARLNNNYDGDWAIFGNAFWEGAGRHTHDPDPGIIEFDGTDGREALYPSDCDVLINGQSAGVSLGDGTGEFKETVDIGGRMDEGLNTVEVTSESLGHITASVVGDAFRRVRGGRT